jgi:peptidoglycan hydrolase-like protein with peptidoglycan-binding domain
MRHFKIASIAFLGLAAATVGCNKKADDVNLATNTGFDSLQTEELAQLPQAGGASTNQQTAIEILPIETSPVTQAVSTTNVSSAAPSAASEGLSYQQKIQTALKNAGLYNGSIDGKIGPGTRKAIETFQKDHNLKVDGKVGPKTWLALEPYFNGTASGVEATTPA